MDRNILRAKAEAVLFAAGEPLEITKIAQVLEMNIDQTAEILKQLASELDKRESGITLLTLGSRYQLCSRTEFADAIRNVLEMKKNTPLSQAAFEVLAVIAYNQPVTKSFVEQVRGVDCSGVIATLCQRSLIEEKGRLELPGKPLIYGTTPDFMRCFNISSLDELPPLPDNDNIKIEESDEEIENTDIIENQIRIEL